MNAEKTNPLPQRGSIQHLADTVGLLGERQDWIKADYLVRVETGADTSAAHSALVDIRAALCDADRTIQQALGKARSYPAASKEAGQPAPRTSPGVVAALERHMGGDDDDTVYRSSAGNGCAALKRNA